MAFVLTLNCHIVFLYVRPLDLIPGYEALPVMMYLGALQHRAHPGNLVYGFGPQEEELPGISPQIWLTFLFVFMAIFSWLRIGLAGFTPSWPSLICSRC